MIEFRVSVSKPRPGFFEQWRFPLDGTLKLLKLIALGLLVVVLAGGAINTFKLGQMGKVAQQRTHERQQWFRDRLNKLPEESRKKLERDMARMTPHLRTPEDDAADAACEKIRAKEPRRPHRSSPKSIKEQYARSIVRWRKTRNRICDRD